MPLQQGATTSFKVELVQGVHNFGPTSPDTFRIALYTGLATLNADTTVYTTSNEVSGGGYSAGGQNLVVSITPTSSGSTAYLSFANVVWNPASFTARGALIYNASKGNKSVAVLDFGSDKTATNTFTVEFPPSTSTAAIIRIN